jgi:hypothetical protein
MRKKAKIVICLLCAAALFLAVRGFVNYIPTPETNLEFWITDAVDRTDLATHREKFGLMGGKEYYGEGYMPTQDENGEQKDPAHCVIYTVTSYPDYISNKQCVTQIYITDPDVEFYGINCQSSLGEIDTALRQRGFRPSDAPGVAYRKGKTTIRISDGTIRIGVKVSNFFRIQF